MAKYFGTDGIRGTVGEFPITPDFALRLGYAVGVVLARHAQTKPQVIIGKDTRISGYLFESSLEAGFSYAGVDVYMAGPIPTPAIAYLTKSLDLTAGVVISASHNVYSDNGIKFFAKDGCKLSDTIEHAIETQLEKPMIKAHTLGKVTRLHDALERYALFCKQSVDRRTLNLKNKKIVIDCANGATYHVAPQIFSDLGAQVMFIACAPDGTNINRDCGSTHLDLLLTTVRNEKADLGIAFDGDGDRVLFVDGTGNIYNGDKLLYILIKDRLKTAPHLLFGVVGTIMTNFAFEQALQKLHIKLVRAKVGDRYVLEELKQREWLLGGEASGHILCLDKHSTGDGIISALMVLAALSNLNQPLKDIIDWVDYPQVMVNVPINAKMHDWEKIIAPVLQTAQHELADNGRIIVRKSGTENLLRIMVEAQDTKVAQDWSQQIVSLLEV